MISSSPSPFPTLHTLLYAISASLAFFAIAASSTDLYSLFHSESASDHAKFVDGGQELQLLLDQTNASGFQSYDAYLYGYFNMAIKLAPGDSAGTVTTYYFSSLGSTHDELDFEFLGNVSGEPIVLQTNVYANGVGGREQRIFLWFDPTADFHNYTIVWNPSQVVFYVDGIPIRVYPNIEAQTGVPYLHNQSMNVYATIWDGDDWATQGGLIKIDWTHSPFIASYRDFSFDACSKVNADNASQCASRKWWNQDHYQILSDAQLGQLKWVQDNLTIYNYCTDYDRYNVTPPECLHMTPIAIISSPSPTTSAASSPSSSLSSPASSSPLPSPSNSQPHSSWPPNMNIFAITTLVTFLSSFYVPLLT